MKKSILKESFASVLGTDANETQVISDSLLQSKEIKKEMIMKDAENKLKELDGQQSSELNIPLPAIKPVPTDVAVQDCRKLITNFKSYLEEKQKEIDQEKSPQIIQTANKNAYEIRLQVLELAVKVQTNTPGGIQSPQHVLNTAEQFYKFVENRR